MHTHGMGFGVCLCIIYQMTCLIPFALGRVLRQSLSSQTADTINSFQQGFGELKGQFNSAVSIQTLKVVEVLKSDLRNIGDSLFALADESKHSSFRRASP